MLLTGFLLAAGAGFRIIQSGLQLVADQVAEDIQSDPVILEHIGTIETIRPRLITSCLLPQEEVFAYKLTGTKDRGTLIASSTSLDDATERVNWGMLRVKSTGQTLALTSDRDACIPDP